MDRAFGGGAGTFLAICARDVVSFLFVLVEGIAHHILLPSSFVLFPPYVPIVEFNDH